MSGPRRPMRRAEREIVDRAALDGILHRAVVLSLAIHDEPAPYVVPVCFGMDGDVLYIHSALAGTKLDLISRNPVVSFCACADVALAAGDVACSWTVNGTSVVGTGRARIVTDEPEKRRGLDSIMRHYDDASAAPPLYRPESLARTCVIAVNIDTLQGKTVGRGAVEKEARGSGATEKEPAGTPGHAGEKASGSR